MVDELDNTLVCPRCRRGFAHDTDRCPHDGALLCHPQAFARVGMRIANYEIKDVLGAGAMAEVYRAEHMALKRPLALKMLRREHASRSGAAERFLREAQALGRIRHPNIVDVTDYGIAPDGEAYFVMEYLEGISLRGAMAKDAPFSVFKAVSVVRQIAGALAAAHDNGIVHRDLKPENIFLIPREGRRRVVQRVNDRARPVEVRNEGSFEFVKLLDFGVAKMLDQPPSTATRDGVVFGTPHYMAPEQAQGQSVDQRCDVYAVGAMFYEMITGMLPFDGESVLEILNGHVFEHVNPPVERCPQLEIDDCTNRTILRCMEKRPTHRFGSMDELQDALRGCYTDRLMLRDAAELTREAAEDRSEPRAKRHRITDELAELFGDQPTPAPAASEPEAPRARRKRKKSLTDELGELFGRQPGGGESKS